jgi:hypothetical protein
MGSFVPFVPTPFEEIDAFFVLAPLSSDDVVYDQATVVACSLITEASTALKPKFEAELKPVSKDRPIPGT